MFRRTPKHPLERALDMVDIIAETARAYIHDKDYIPTPPIMAQLQELRKSVGLLQGSISYIIRMLEYRLTELDPTHTDDR